MSKIKTLSGAGLVVSLDDQGGLVVEGLKSLHPQGADEMRRYVRENKAQIIAELRDLAKQAKSQGVEGVEIVEPGSAEKQNANTNANMPPWKPSPKVAALELCDMAQDGRLDLAWADNGPTWSIPLEHEQADRDWIGGLVAEAMLETDYFRQRLERVQP
jgi:hypothetical protein